jgi:hypothetical protein
MLVLAAEPQGPQVAWPDEERPQPEALAAPPLESQLKPRALPAFQPQAQPLRDAQLAQAPEASLPAAQGLPEYALPEAAEQGMLSVLPPAALAQPQV